jgi:hypothetical protein
MSSGDGKKSRSVFEEDWTNFDRGTLIVIMKEFGRNLLRTFTIKGAI